MCAKSSSGVSYDGCGGVSNLGNYTNTTEIKTKNSNKDSYKNREDVLNTLVSGSPMSKNIKQCVELISTSNKKGIKIKSEE